MTPSPPALSLKIRPAAEVDCRLLWSWANDPAVRRSAFCPDPITWEAHEAWFRSKQADPGCALFILTDEEGRPVGQVRFDRQADGSVETDISLAREARGLGLGAGALQLACEALKSLWREARIVAYIKPDNLASIRTFEKAGFVFQEKRWVKGNEAILMAMGADHT